MNLKSYLEKKAHLKSLEFQPRQTCRKCLNPAPICYCHLIEPFDSTPTFAILMHPNEAERTIATGRMAHLSLKNSYLIEGINFTNHSKVNSLIQNPNYAPFLLFPRWGAPDISQAAQGISSTQKPLAFILDATWSKARLMYHLSSNLRSLPHFQMNPERRSRFQVRKQPAPHCLSTIETVGEVIHQFQKKGSKNRHHSILRAFEFLNEKQKSYQRT